MFCIFVILCPWNDPTRMGALSSVLLMHWLRTKEIHVTTGRLHCIMWKTTSDKTIIQRIASCLKGSSGLVYTTGLKVNLCSPSTNIPQCCGRFRNKLFPFSTLTDAIWLLTTELPDVLATLARQRCLGNQKLVIKWRGCKIYITKILQKPTPKIMLCKRENMAFAGSNKLWTIIRFLEKIIKPSCPKNDIN